MMPVATAGLLQAALKEELQQLEPQFLPLFGAGRERLAVPTARTHAALKMLVALTRFFPAEHRVRNAGKQLEMIWPPLVHEPRGAVAGKLLHYYFRVRQDLLGTPAAALQQQLQDMVQAGIDQTLRNPGTEHGVDCLQRLQQLAVFLPELPTPALPPARLSTLVQLYKWQQQLELAAAAEHPELTAAQQVLTPWLEESRDRCAVLYAASDGSLGYFCQSGLARSLWQLRWLPAFAGDAAKTEWLAAAGDNCLDLHLAGTTPHADLVQDWLVTLFTTSRVRAAEPSSNTPAEPVLDPVLQVAYEQELAHYRTQVLETLAQGAPLRVTAHLITMLYKATWIFTAAASKHWARLSHCAYRVAVQFWRIKQPLPMECHAVLWRMWLALDTPVAPDTLRNWRESLLQHWPNWTGDGKRVIALQADAERAMPLDAVPLLLSGSFATLVWVPAESFGESPASEVSRQLLQELTLLEKGAAAMKVWPLEQLCTLLIAIFEAHLREAAVLPATLLQTAHRQLVNMLDQSAAWQEAQCDESLIRELEAWLTHRSVSREPMPGMEAHAMNTSALQLREQLLAHLGPLATVLERPVRLQLDMGGVGLDEGRVAQVVDCLRPLVKFMLLDRSVDTHGRHAMHKPRVSTLTVTLRATSATLILSVAEDSHEEALPQSEVQRLQRRLPGTAGPLVCESRAGLGRCFSLTLL